MITPGPIGTVISTWPYRAPVVAFWLSLVLLIVAAATGSWSVWMFLLPPVLPFVVYLIHWRIDKDNWKGAKKEWELEIGWVELMGKMAHHDQSDFNNVAPHLFVSADFRDYYRPNSRGAVVKWLPAAGAKSLSQSAELFHRQLIQEVSGDQESSQLRQAEPEPGKPRPMVSIISDKPLTRPDPVRGVMVAPTRSMIEKMKGMQ